jgi:glycosyltransferase involved in cell wall biosynthesis
MPIAFEQFDFSKYKLVISVTSESAKGIISLPGTTHVCMCLTPTRYLYHQKNLYLQNQIHKVTAKYITYWDQVAKARPDYWLAISKTVQERIKKYYGQDSTVIYPPVNTDFFTPGPAKESGYFLVVNRLVAHKNTKAIIEVFNSLDLPLLIVGDGPERKKLESLANSNVIFTGQVSDEKLLGYYRGCTSLIFFHEEDFGLTPLEAMSCGKPVIALNIGGASETVIDGQTGMLVNDVVSLSDAIVNFSASRFDSHFIVSHAQNFSQKTFEKNILNFFAKLYP